MDCCKGKELKVFAGDKEVATIKCTGEGVHIHCTEEGKKMCGEFCKSE